MAKSEKAKIPSYKDLFKLNQSYIDFVLERSFVSHQYLKNISLTGNQAEVAVRKILNSILPDRFKVTHGYIAKTKDYPEGEPIISPQLDLIIVDTLVPHRIFIFDEEGQTELVPFESVLGIIEIKRTLDKKALTVAYDKLSNIIKLFNITKKDSRRFLPGGFTLGGRIQGGFSGNPLLGVVGLKNDITNSDFNKCSDLTFKDTPYPDIVTTLDGKRLVLSRGTKKESSELLFCNPIKEIDDVDWVFETLKITDSESTAAIAKGLGFIVSYLSSSCASSSKIVEYYFTKLDTSS